MQGRHNRIGAPLLALLTLGLPAFSAPGMGQCLYDDFEQGTLDRWNVVLGNWEVISQNGNHVAHLTRSSTPYRRMVSKTAVPNNITITARVRGDCDPSDPMADVAVGFYANAPATRFYFAVLGRNDQLAIYRFDNEQIYELAHNPDVTSDNNVWYNMKIWLENNIIRVKRWQVGNEEPPGWQLTYAGARPDGGHLVLGGIAGQHNEEFWFDDVVADYWPGMPDPPAEEAEGDQQDTSGSDGDPVNTATGNFFRDEADLSIASRGQVVLCSRGYNSLAGSAASRQPGNKAGWDRTATPLGPGWTHSYYIWLEPNAPDEQVGVHYGDGHADYWISDGQGGYVMSVPGVYDRLVHDPNDPASPWTLTQTNEDVYRFDAEGRLLSITDKNGNVTALAYDNPNVPYYPTAVTDPVGRSLTLDYIDVGGGEWRLRRVTDWTGRYVEYTYTNGYLTDVRDVLGEHITYTYDENGYLAAITDQRGVMTVQNTYDENGRVLEQLDARGNPTTFNYGVFGEADTTFTRHVTVEGESEPRELSWFHPHEERYKRQLEHVDPLGVPVAYDYDGMFNRNRITDRNGNVTLFSYDERGNVTEAREADDPNDPYDGGVTAVAYADPNDPNAPPCPHVPLSKTDALGYVTEWQYDENCNVIRERRYLDPNMTVYVEKSWTYNDFGQRTSETDERGNTHYWIYDENGLLVEEIDREGNHTWYGYDELWRRVWVTDGRGGGPEDPAYTTRFFYDNADRLIRIEGPPVGDPPHSIVQTFGYDAIGNRTSVTDGNGNTTRYVYDNNSNLIQVEEPEGRTTWFVYDELNRKVRMYDANNDPNDPNSAYTWYVYDDGDRLVETHDPEGNVWTYQYDLQGNLTREEDSGGVWTEHEYDALNRRVLTRNAAGETRFVYDQLGRLISRIDANGNETQFNYDALGRLSCVIDAEGGWTEYTYDAAGNLIRIEDANDNVISIREYDANNRLIRAWDGNGNHYEYGYDAVGNQIWVIDANGDRTDLTYDAENRLVRIDYPDGSWVTYEYDDNGNRVAMTDPTGSSTFTYDGLNRLTSSTDSFGQTVRYGYDPVGNRTTLTYPDGKVVTYAYDAANRLTTITDWAARQTAYTYECCNRLDTVTYPNGVVEDRGYDEAGRLVSMVTTDSGSDVLLSFDWVRDGVGNPTSATETGTLQPALEQLATEYEYDADNRLVESSQGTYEYDANGNLISRTVGGVTTTFTYDAEDRLVAQTTGGSTVTHVYDGQGYRIARIDNGVETRYVLDRGRSMSHVLCETDATGTITAYYIHGLQLVARIGADGSQRYYHTNDVGHVVALTDENEQISDRYAYTPFGLPRGHEGTTEQPFTYVGGLGVMAEADGLYFMRARFYDPDTGRFLGKDPVEGALSNPRGLHRYACGLNNPIVNVDPSGLWFGLGELAKGLRSIVRYVVLPGLEAGLRGAGRVLVQAGELIRGSSYGYGGLAAGLLGQFLGALGLYEWSVQFTEPLGRIANFDYVSRLSRQVKEGAGSVERRLEAEMTRQAERSSVVGFAWDVAQEARKRNLSLEETFHMAYRRFWGRD